MKHLKTYESNSNINNGFIPKNGDHVKVNYLTGTLNNIWSNYVYVIKKIGKTSEIKYIDDKTNIIETMNVYNSVMLRVLTEEEIEKFNFKLTIDKYNL